MIVQIYKVDEITFNKVYETCWPKEICSKLMKHYLTVGRKGMDRKRGLYDTETKTLLCRLIDLQFIQGADKVTDDYWKDIAIQIDESATEEVRVDDLYIRPYAKQSEKYIHTILHDFYTDQEIDDCLKSYTVDELTLDTQMIHSNMPWYYDTDKLYYFENVVYYDINNAHLDALTEIFPKAKRKLVAIRTRINRLKATGKKNEARKLKDMVNFYVGNLCNRGYRTTNNWIVARTRKKIDKLIEYCEGEVLYANTDGVIINNPKKTINTSKELGKFKSETTDGKLWYYLNTKQTRWQLYQYHSDNGIEKKGTAQLMVRDKIDLENNKIVLYDLDRSSNTRKAINIKEINLCEEMCCHTDKM